MTLTKGLTKDLDTPHIWKYNCHCPIRTKKQLIFINVYIDYLYNRRWDIISYVSRAQLGLLIQLMWEYYLASFRTVFDFLSSILFYWLFQLPINITTKAIEKNVFLLQYFLDHLINVSQNNQIGILPLGCSWSYIIMELSIW